jgi:hypothetical protein
MRLLFHRPRVARQRHGQQLTIVIASASEAIQDGGCAGRARVQRPTGLLRCARNDGGKRRAGFMRRGWDASVMDN